MKKIIVLILLFLFAPTLVMAEDTVSGEYGTYDNAVKIVQEVLKDYYLRGPYLQYNYAKATYGTESPEEATSQDYKYTVCAAYSTSTYAEALGMKNSNGDGFPRYNYEVLDVARDYYNNYKDNPEKMDGNFLIYYEKPDSNIKYVASDVTRMQDFANIIQPGDIFVYTGHVMVAYEPTINLSTESSDVFMLEAGGVSTIRSRIDGTNNLYNNMFESTVSNANNIIIPKEGGIKKFWLSSRSGFYKTVSGVKTLSCQKKECAVIRPYYRNSDGNAVFNYKILPSKYQKSLLRVEYPGLTVEKTVDKYDNNVVYPNDILTYTIKITNNSNVTTLQNPVNYGAFKITETLGDYVDYVSATDSASYANRQITWNIDGLANNESIELKYKVKVKDNEDIINQTIVSDGIFYKDDTASISTGKVKNKIVKKVTNKSKEYSSCYTKGINNNKEGLELIDYIYDCVWGVDFSFKTFDFNDIYNKKVLKNKAESKGILFKEELSNQASNYKNSILNGYWSGVVEMSSTDTDSTEDEDQVSKYTIPRWVSSNELGDRAKTIFNEHFKNGDVLIYSIDYSTTPSNLQRTKEDGLYVYVYIDGRFVGLNGIDGHERDEFTYNYYNDNNLDLDTYLYSKSSVLGDDIRESVLSFVNLQTLFDKDYYMILRPELLIQEQKNSVIIDNRKNNSQQITKKQEEIENPSTGIILPVISLLTLSGIGGYLLYTSKKKKKIINI